MSGSRRTEAAWQGIVSGEDRRLRAGLARAALTPLAWLYGGVVSVYRQLYEWRLLRTTRLPCTTIAVGNLTVGGTGKSTTVSWLAREITARGLRAAVLSYGYHGSRSSSGDEATTVVSDGERILVSVARSGDEPRMLAEALPGVPVLAGPRRVLTGQRAVREFGAEVLLLDDGFQYWRLEKDLEILLVDALCPFGYGHLLPRGLLREPLRAMGRADVVILMNGHRLEERAREDLRQRLLTKAPRALQLEARHRPTQLRPLWMGETQTRELSWLEGRRVVALSSLGNPEGFERMLCDLGVAAVEARRFPDHHGYTPREAASALRLEPPWEAVITTAKDAPKLVAALEEGGVSRHAWVLEVDLDLEGRGAPLMERIAGHLRRSQREPEVPAPT